MPLPDLFWDEDPPPPPPPVVEEEEPEPEPWNLSAAIKEIEADVVQQMAMIEDARCLALLESLGCHREEHRRKSVGRPQDAFRNPFKGRKNPPGRR